MGEIAFSWRPGLLEWILVLELVTLASMALFRYIGRLLGKGSPTDFFVIFYRVFWTAMLQPSRFPIPVNYLPVPPKHSAPRREDYDDEDVSLTEDELERLMAGEDLDGDTSGRRSRRDRPDTDDGFGGTVQLDLEVKVVPGERARLVGEEFGVLIVEVDVAPDDGRANKMVIREISTLLSIQSHQVAIAGGHMKPEKQFKVSGVSREKLEERLRLLRTQGPNLANSQRGGDETLGFR